MNLARRYPRFRRLLASLAVSQAGDWLYNLALLAFVYERTHSSAWLGITTAARVLPIVVCGPLGGVLADRYDRRRIMIASDAIRLGLMLALAAVAATGLPIVLAPVIAALSTAASSAYMPCVAASTPRLVDDADLPAANAARSAIGQICIVAGPGFGALLLLVGSPSLAFRSTARPSRCPRWPSPRCRRARSSRPAGSPSRRRTSCASWAPALAHCCASPSRCASSAPT
jgi:MFS family permease